MSIMWGSIYKLGTDVAGFALYHPDRLKAWNKVDIGWWTRRKKRIGAGGWLPFAPARTERLRSSS